MLEEARCSHSPAKNKYKKISKDLGDQSINFINWGLTKKGVHKTLINYKSKNVHPDAKRYNKF